MKIYTSYFYQIRFFKPYMIPLSTAAWDPKWYYDFQYQGHVWQDKNKVWNGLRAKPLVFPTALYELLESKGEGCDKFCSQQPPNCGFMIEYRKYLDSLDFSDIYNRCVAIASTMQEKSDFTEDPVIVLMVHEPPQRLCAERPVLQDWFEANGHPITEWQNPNKQTFNEQLVMDI